MPLTPRRWPSLRHRPFRWRAHPRRPREHRGLRRGQPVARALRPVPRRSAPRDPHRRARRQIIGYAMLVRDSGAAELSKIYVLPEYHGGGVSVALMEAALATADGWGVRRVWLGSTRQTNARNAFTPRAASGSAAPGRFSSAPTSSTTTSWFASWASRRQRQQPGSGPQVLFRYPPASISWLKIASSLVPDATTGMPAS